ncbi:MAG TPA: M1 family aminopeptidase [Verrucomicrobiae bacterium]|jgi:ABC-2 type transport system permease protein|nr:M1 family aminopeptidase [Verrucomicrobiae bacterium]
MLANIFLFEIQQRLRRLSTYVYFVVFFALGLLFVLMSGGAFANASVDFGTGGKVLITSPYALNGVITFICFFGIVITAAIAGQATYQDIDSNSAVFFYTAPITKFDYLGGRFLAAFAIQVLIFSSVGLGAWIGTLTPWLDKTRVGPQMVGAYFQPYFINVLPNLLFLTAIFFALSTLSRKMLPVYVASVLVLIGYFTVGQLNNTTLTASVRAALADPLGGAAIDRITRYWTPFQRNTQLIPLEGIIFANRALWLGLGAIFLIFAYVKFEFAYPAEKSKRRVAVDEKEEVSAAQTLPIAHPTFSASASFQHLIALTRIHFRETTKNIFFLVLMLAGFLFAALTASGITNPQATRTYPVTYQMLEFASAGFSIFAIAIIIFYSGELVWRERDAQLSQVIDAFPLQRWVLFCSKLLALMLVQVLVVLLIFASGLTVQVAQGFYHFQFGLYFRELFLDRLTSLWILCVLAIFIQTIVNNKYLGHFVMVLYIVATIALPPAGFQNYLYRFGEAPQVTYSDINRYGPFLQPLIWFRIYWIFGAILLAILTNLLWVRGTESSFRVRMSQAATRFSGASMAGVFVCLIAMAGVGGYIFYNTHVLNHYQTTFQIDEARAQYEKKYKQYWELPQPRITDVKTEVDFYPERRAFSMRGTMWLENKTSTPIDQVAITLWPVDLIPLPRLHMQVNKLNFVGGQTPIIEDAALGFYQYKLPNALPPNGRIQLDYDLQYDNPGFQNDAPNTDIVENGSFINDRYGPYIGYAQEVELTDDSTRHRHGLATARRMPKLEDVAAREYNSVAFDADWINFEATVSTSPDQIAIAPGYLQKEWMENGRRYFQYKMDAPILNIYSFQSARYAVRRDHWNNVNLEIYYQPGHEFDIDTMMESMKETLAYCSENFSPFQFHQLRIIEFPRYGTFAESFANTVPFSESIGFLTKMSDKPDSVVLPFYVTAHETGHQWWAHQVISAYVEGDTSIDETMAQYTALMVMKHHYGPESMKRFLRFELDQYLRGRANERNEENPLYKVDQNQGYVHYRKGSMAMYALQDYIGEDKVNEAIRGFLKQYAFKGPPYPTSLDLEGYFQKVTPPQYQYLLEDLFRTITLYDNRALAASYQQLPDGKYQVSLTVEAKKFRADGKGQEHSIPVNDWMDIGVLDADGQYLYLQKQKIDQEKTDVTITVDKKPVQAGIDPLDKLIDRNPDDNVMAVAKK